MTADECSAFMTICDAVTPIKRHGTPDEVARTVLSLGFDATFPTGELIKVDRRLGKNLSASPN